MIIRPSGRALDELRSVSIETGVTRHAEGSCLIKCGGTHVICTATVEDKPPPFLRNTGMGWVTAEYGMLPRSTHTRSRREARQRASRAEEPRKFNGLSVAACAPWWTVRPWANARLHRRLRCDPGRWRHALRLDHRVIYPIQALHEQLH